MLDSQISLDPTIVDWLDESYVSQCPKLKGNFVNRNFRNGSKKAETEASTSKFDELKYLSEWQIR